MSVGCASLFFDFFARMFLVHAFSHAMILAIIITVMAEEKMCDLLGEQEQESTKELALMNRLKPLFNQSFETESMNDDGHYIYRLRICREVFSNMTNSGLVQISKIDNKQKVIGRINETHLANGTSWIMLIYQGGDPYGNHCTQEDRKALVMIICNRTTLATGFTMVAEEREKIKQCSYVFELESSLACPPEELHQNVHHHLSIGSILLITFFSLIAVYIIGGFLYQRLIVGAKGMEQFPHFAFWQDLGNLVADGCDFMCRSKPQNVPAAYRGVGDDQLGEESEEQDDHLLPM
ncbi:cation-dependent mannose-6-phosphate receptor isoform X3 [Crotalus tigris]|uniref:cation-dependent mannose-6-phosphate receptor isoform X3 n=1 Tax=Crotalus tigris TaxID=88082 RepID=UPI00192F6F0E|nr:cation-dependent mannose-6-phosphate receptor isoform X3 [Crotalus tigris]